MAGRFGRARTKNVPSSRPTLTGWRRLYLFLTLYFFFIVRFLSIPAAMRCIIRKAQSVRWEELPVKASEELPLPIGLSQPTTKLASLSLPPSAALFAAAVGTPSNPNTPVFHGTSPSFTAFTLETPSPTFSAFPFSSISPTFSFPTAEVSAAVPELVTTVNKQEKKPETPKQSTNLKLHLTGTLSRNSISPKKCRKMKGISGLYKGLAQYRNQATLLRQIPAPWKENNSPLILPLCQERTSLWDPHSRM